MYERHIYFSPYHSNISTTIFGLKVFISELSESFSLYCFSSLMLGYSKASLISLSTGTGFVNGTWNGFN